MSITVAELDAKLRMDTKNFEAGAKRAQKSAIDMKSIAEAALGFSVANASEVAARAVVNFAKQSVQAASALQEQLSGAKVTFGEASQAVVDFADKSSGALGLARSEALAAANSFGNMFKSAGAGAQQSATASESMVRLAADIASFRDVAGGVPAVLDKLRAGLIGETEPLRSVGVFLSDAAVQTKAAELGFKAVNGKLSEGQKIAARYAIIMDQTSDAQGDMARTASSLANQQRIVGAEFKRLQEDLGKALIPVVGEGINAFRGLIEVIKGVGDALAGQGGATKDFEIFGASWKTVLDTVTDFTIPGKVIVGTLADMGRSASEAGVENVDLMKTLELEQQQIKLTEESIKKMNQETRDGIDAKRAFRDASRGVTDAERNLADAQDEVNRLNREGAVDAKKVAAAERDVAAASKTLARAHEEVTDAQKELSKLHKELETLLDPKAAAEAQAEAQNQLAGAQLNQKSAVLDTIDAQTKLNEVTAGSQATVEDLERAELDVLKAKKKKMDIIDREGVDALALMDAQNDIEDAERRLIELQKGHVPTANELSRATLDLEKSLLREKEAAQGVKEAERAVQDAQKIGTEQAPAVIAVRDQIEDANKRLKESESGVAEALAGLGLAEADLREARAGDPNFARDLRNANYDLRDATYALEAANYALARAGADAFDVLGAENASMLQGIGLARQLAAEYGLLGTMMGSLGTQIGHDSGNILSGARPQTITANSLMNDLLVPRFHSGGVVPGPPGSDVPIMAQAGETVIPAGGRSGGTTINITVTGAMDPKAVARQIKEMLDQLDRQRGF